MQLYESSVLRSIDERGWLDRLSWVGLVGLSRFGRQVGLLFSTCLTMKTGSKVGSKTACFHLLEIGCAVRADSQRLIIIISIQLIE